MNTIGFNKVVPQIFAQCTDSLSSDIWCKNISFEKGGLYLVEADSGKGKSTFCSYAMGYRHDYTGSVMFDTVPASSFKVSDWIELRKHHLAYLFQELRLFPELTAYENVEIKNKLTGFKTRKQIVEWFELLGIGDKLDAKISRMSFGQQQRVAMMRALAQPFDFILADEPISHLDETNAAVMAQLRAEEAGRQGTGILVTSIGKHLEMNYHSKLKL